MLRTNVLHICFQLVIVFTQLSITNAIRVFLVFEIVWKQFWLLIFHIFYIAFIKRLLSFVGRLSQPSDHSWMVLMLQIAVGFEVLPCQYVLIIWVVVWGTLGEFWHHWNRSRNFLSLIFVRSLILISPSSCIILLVQIRLILIWSELLYLVMFDNFLSWFLKLRVGLLILQFLFPQLSQVQSAMNHKVLLSFV
jgi:hypothetical protein